MESLQILDTSARYLWNTDAKISSVASKSRSRPHSQSWDRSNYTAIVFYQVGRWRCIPIPFSALFSIQDIIDFLVAAPQDGYTLDLFVLKSHSAPQEYQNFPDIIALSRSYAIQVPAVDSSARCAMVNKIRFQADILHNELHDNA